MAPVGFGHLSAGAGGSGALWLRGSVVQLGGKAKGAPYVRFHNAARAYEKSERVDRAGYEAVGQFRRAG